MIGKLSVLATLAAALLWFYFHDILELFQTATPMRRDPIIESARPKSNDVQAITKKACAIHLAFLDAKPGTLTPASLYEHLGIRAADDVSLDAFRAAADHVGGVDGAAEGTGIIVKAANLLMTERERSVYDNVFMPALRGERGGKGDRAMRAAAGLSVVCGWNAGGAEQ